MPFYFAVPSEYGRAQLIFYLLLVSLAELVGFDWAFLVAGSATVALLAWNAAWVFGSRSEQRFCAADSGWRGIPLW